MVEDIHSLLAYSVQLVKVSITKRCCQHLSMMNRVSQVLVGKASARIPPQRMNTLMTYLHEGCITYPKPTPNFQLPSVTLTLTLTVM